MTYSYKVTQLLKGALSKAVEQAIHPPGSNDPDHLYFRVDLTEDTFVVLARPGACVDGITISPPKADSTFIVVKGKRNEEKWDLKKQVATTSFADAFEFFWVALTTEQKKLGRPLGLSNTSRYKAKK